MTYNPWDDAGRRHPGWVIERVPLKGLHEVMCVQNRIILLEHDRTKWERRCDLAHAIAHIDLGHRDRFDRKSEAAAVRHSAKMLIDLHELGEALVLSEGKLTAEAAEELLVDLPTLTARCRHLHPAEAGYLRRRLAHLEMEHAA